MVETAAAPVLAWEPFPYRLRGVLAGETVFDTTEAKILYELGHVPVYYVPEAAIGAGVLEPSAKTSHCPRKGDATYRTLVAGGRVAEDAVWAYREPFESASFLAGHAAFYWHMLDEWLVEDQVVGGPACPVPAAQG